MRTRLYQILVNRKPGIRQRYHNAHDGAAGAAKIASWGYLLWLNICYYLFFCRFLGKAGSIDDCAGKRIPLKKSESQLAAVQHKKALAQCKKKGFARNGLRFLGAEHGVDERTDHSAVERWVDFLAQYDVISFDIFDTLLFRPFSSPTDLFYLLGEELDFLDFKRIRMEMEARARQEKFEKCGSYEVTLADIWRVMERETGLDAKEGMCLETELERQLCYANPFMAEVFTGLLQRKKRIIIVSDMYLPEAFLEELLNQNGYEGYVQLYVSNAYGKSKWDGQLFDTAREEQRRQAGSALSLIHVGDHPHSDVKMAKKHGFAALHYPNADAAGAVYRAQDMSALIGGAYRGLVNHHLYTGQRSYSQEYEYGYAYGGLFVVGYCRFIHEYTQKNQIDKLLFLSRDGDILKTVYDRLYPGGRTKYVYWSRAAALKLTADENRYDFFRRFLYHKVNKGVSVAQILREMELEGLIRELPEGLAGDRLTSGNAGQVKRFLLAHWEQVLAVYAPQLEAAKRYLGHVLEGCRRAAAVDVGWAGSGAMALSVLAEKVWHFPCEIFGILAGTNSMYNAEPDTSEPQLQSGRLVSYLFSQAHNRDLLKKHDPGKGDNIYWELLLSSPTRQFIGFYLQEQAEEDLCARGGLGITLRFGAAVPNREGCQQIQQGIVDFAQDYQRHFASHPYMFAVGGRDAYAPMLAAMGQRRKYLRTIAARLETDISVSCGGAQLCRNI